MKHLVYVTLTGADNRSRSEAQRRNCGPVTTHWWEVVEGADGSFACTIPEKPGEEDNLSAADRARLSTTFTRKPPEIAP
jgi:hypothetical protein